MAEGHVAEETFTFFSQFLEGIETRMNRLRRVNDYPEDRDLANSSSIFPPVGKGVGAETFELSPMVKRQAHRYVVLNCPQVMPFIERKLKKFEVKGQKVLLKFHLMMHLV